MSGPRTPDDGPSWPNRDLSREDGAEDWVQPTPSSGQQQEEQPAEAPAAEAGQRTTAFSGGEGWDPRLHGDRRRPTTAEQAVPWMIGVILALAGIVIVLLALIFTSPDGLVAGTSASPSGSGAPVASGSVLPPSQPAASVAATATPDAPAGTPTPVPTVTPSPTPVPEYGPLEMVYLGRPSAVAPIYLLRRDFSVEEEPAIMAQAEQGVEKFAWSPDGRVGAAIIGGRAVALTPGESARALADDVSALTFGWDSETVYAVRITRDGANDVADLLQIDFVSGGAETLASVTYPHPVTGPDAPLREAQFIDNGGLVRLYAVADGHLTLWILGAPEIYRVDPGDGTVTPVSREPILWSPDGHHRIDLNENSNGTTQIVLRNQDGDSEAVTSVTGLVSHIRWVRTNNEIVFTIGRLGNSGGVRQDLHVWNLQDGDAPMPLTSNGVSFGAEWLGAAPNWLP